MSPINSRSAVNLRMVYGFAAASMLTALLYCIPADALPMYAQRSGRTCANCHVSPTLEDPKGWDNPALAERKCNLSCVSCHVNPTGGGLRNSSGRYYGQSTLSMLPFQERSYSDRERELMPDGAIYRAIQLFKHGAPKDPKKRTIPSDEKEVAEGIGEGASGGVAQFGHPFFGPSPYAYWDGRYGDLIADPLFQAGADARLAFWSGSESFFPMQLDADAAIHPVEHLTAMVTLAARGRTEGPKATLKQEGTPYFLRNAFVMVHELPAMAYAKAGIFMPAFGTNIDDHTSPIRDFFNMDTSSSDDTVTGIEIGAAANYPFINASLFNGNRPLGSAADIDGGQGGAVNLGWRDLGWGVTAHGMVKRRPLESGGNVDAGGIGWSFNPFYYSNSIPLTYMGEFSAGHFQRAYTGSQTLRWAMYHELWWTLWNGVSVRAKADFGNRDVELQGSSEARYALGMDISPFPGLTLNVQGRYLKPALRKSGMDIFAHLHFWF